MAYISKSFIQASNTAFFKNFAEYTGKLLYPQFCIQADSKGKTETYEWFGQVPGMNEWVDERSSESLKDFSYTLKNKDYEATIGIDKNTFDDDQSGQINIRLNQLAPSAAEHPELLFLNLLTNGAANLCFDGGFFFSAAHPALFEGGAAYSNLVTGTGVTAALIQADFASAQALYQAYLKRNGLPVITYNPKITILHSPALSGVMKVAFNQQYNAGPVDNIYWNAAVPIAHGSLTGNDWYVLIDTPVVKPFVYQIRKTITPAWDEARVFSHKKIFFGVDARYNMGYYHPQTCIKIDN